MTSHLPDDPPKAALITCKIEGLEVETDWPTLRAYLMQQAKFSDICMRVVSSGRTLAAVITFPLAFPTAEFAWNGYQVEVKALGEELHIVCRKRTDGLDM